LGIADHVWSLEEVIRLLNSKDDPAHITVLEIPPVDSAETVIKIALAAKAKQ